MSPRTRSTRGAREARSLLAHRCQSAGAIVRAEFNKQSLALISRHRCQLRPPATSAPQRATSLTTHHTETSRVGTHQVGRDALELSGDGRHALGHDVGIDWHGVRRGAAVWAGGEAREVGLLHAVDVEGLLHAAREAARLAVIQHGIVADRADLLGLLLDLLLRLASQPTLNAGLSLNLQVERGR